MGYNVSAVDTARRRAETESNMHRGQLELAILHSLIK